MAASGRQVKSGTLGFFIPSSRPAEFEIARVSGKAGVHEAKKDMLSLSPDPGLNWTVRKGQSCGSPGAPTGFTDQAMRPVLGA